ncbi:GntR family transcriptional regulator [Flavihumibacter petaseus]|uniref:Putative GntR family transcriptional regulator n=1 Tax=Flavihumibacter petaseus NBRC 106054 TaxID=1220578 RepID=A0A0E9N037_9BACT|nr:GntR family transcriptional regulator [Flavihumibacter petaseus]GAO43362.1 putative GntR family transcriptional regulator [Flavihumibacter petaseus NBRC 106054]
MSKQKNIADIILIDTTLTTPVYKQIVQSIHRNIDNGSLGKDDMLPSVNQIAAHFSLARGSVFTAYNELRSSGIIDSIPGKGYFVTSTETNLAKKIFLLFSTFTPYKETLYNALLNHLPKNASLDIYFHHHSMKMFENLIREQAPYYNTYIIMPETHPDARAILEKLDPKRTFLFDVGYNDYHKNFPGVYQHFEKDIYDILVASKEMMAKYKRLFLVFPASAKTTDIISGFNKFARKKIIKSAVINGINAADVKPGDAFIVIDDNHLVDIVKLAKSQKWQLGKDIGLISYNETNLKSIIGNGITTITTDFVAMGRSMAEMVMTGKGEVIENNFNIIDRNSF